MKTALFILAATFLLAQGLGATQPIAHRVSGDNEGEVAYLNAHCALVRHSASDGDFYSICTSKYISPRKSGVASMDFIGKIFVSNIAALQLLKHFAVGIGVEMTDKHVNVEKRHFILDLNSGHISFFPSEESYHAALSTRLGIKDYPVLLPPKAIMVDLERAFDRGYVSPTPAGNIVTNQKIKTREQLLAAVNTWLRKHHQPEWTLEELIGRTADQAYTLFLSHLPVPVDSFLENLIKGEPFTHDVQLRTTWRNATTLHTPRGAIVRQRIGWQKVFDKQMRWLELPLKHPETERQLSLPPHYALSIDVIATAAEFRDSKANPRESTYREIYLASALAKQKQPAKAPLEGKGGLPELVATPDQLLTAVNAWRQLSNEPAMNLDEITVRVADEILAIDGIEGIYRDVVELFLECVAKDLPFVYPLKIKTQGPLHPDEPDDTKVVSAGTVIPLPSRSKILIEIPPLPGEEFFVDYSSQILREAVENRTMVLSYAFPKEKGKAEEKQKP